MTVRCSPVGGGDAKQADPLFIYKLGRTMELGRTGASHDRSTNMLLNWIVERREMHETSVTSLCLVQSWLPRGR
jgi:hypothetical protein